MDMVESSLAAVRQEIHSCHRPNLRSQLCQAEELPFPDATFDLVVSYLMLIGMPDPARAVAEMVRVLKPGGTVLIANLISFATATIAFSTSDDQHRARKGGRPLQR
ncbi:class I SAM-dependent methyltransferase [Mesorhizobium sp.]|uniref:class I SAM-dependent methyltransferase n=1 Tax=Mesorhizobium sp. TaxID=1871066 RepID=UPI0025E998E3|nr:class I SAM-dependent methyltransferase [Mesorhizobium sp.]